MSATPASVSDGHPLEISGSYCQPVTASALIPSVLVILQCALLHPAFVNSKLAQTIRVGLTPINASWAFMFPFRYCFQPLEISGAANMGMAVTTFYTALKCLEWGFASGPYYKRPLKINEGVPKWEKVKETDDSYKKVQEDEPLTAFKLITWTLLQLTSMRGLQFTWGPAMTANTHSTSYLIGKILRLIGPMTCSLALIVLARDSPLGTLSSGLLSIGVPNFLGLKLLAELVSAASFGIFLACALDTRFTLTTLFVTFLHKIAIFLQLPEHVLELCDPVYYPPMVDSPHNVTSIAEFWGRAWHTVLKRIFLISGGKPAVWITNKLGASSKIQRISGLFGTFAVSAVLHEYLILAITQPPHHTPHTITSFPGSAVYFMLQPVAILIEPFIIPRIPKSLGGGRLWVWTFSFLSSYTFRKQYLVKDGCAAVYPPLSQWSWMYVLSPIKD